MKMLIPNERIIYEREEGVVYARYPNRPDIHRWPIGWDQTAGPQFNYSDWEDLTRLAETNTALKKQLDKLLNLYYLLKDEQ